MQIAAHEDIITVKELYEICFVARHMMTGENEVARIIARPFSGKPGNFIRTNRRKDFPVNIPVPNNLFEIVKSDYPVSCIGRTSDFFANYCNRSDKPVNMEESLQSTIMYQKLLGGFVFVNLGDFDSKYGHRRDKEGYAKELLKLNKLWDNFVKPLNSGDLLLVTSDHGNDPSNSSHTDHTREKVFVLGFMKGYTGVELQNVEMIDISATVCDFFGITPVFGKSFLQQIKSRRRNRTTHQ
jgi:phosphopentomutase